MKSLDSIARHVWVPAVLGATVLATWLILAVIDDVYWTNVGVKTGVALIVVLGLQIFSGNSGVLSFGHISFMAIGAYSSALLTMPPTMKEMVLPEMPAFMASWIYPIQLGPTEGVILGGLVAMAFGALTAAPIARLAGVAAGIATLAVIVMVNVFITESPITNGKNTLIGVPQTTTLAAVTVWTLIFLAVAYAFKESPLGLRLRASRENERAARSVGIGIKTERGVAWVVSAFVVGVAGALYGHYFTAFSSADFYFNNGLNFILLTVAMLVVGGMISVTGAVVGCYVITIVHTAFSRWEITGLLGYTPPAGVANLAVALVLVFALILRPNGLTKGREIPWLRGRRNEGAGVQSGPQTKKDPAGANVKDGAEAAP